MADKVAVQQTTIARQQAVIARMERLPFHSWHVKMRLIVGVATFFDGIDALMLAYILPVLVHLWKIPPTRIGLLISTGYIGQTVGAIFFGWFAERHGRIRSLTYSVIILAVGSLLCALSWSYASLLAFRLFQGLGLGGEVPIAATYINEVAQARGRGRFFTLFEVVFTFGLFFSGLIAYVVMPTLGWHALFVIGAVPAAMVPFYLRRIPESPRWLASKGRIDEAERVVKQLEAIISNNGTKPLPEPDLAKAGTISMKTTDWRELFQGIYLKRTVVLWIIFFLGYFLVYGLQLWIPTLLTTIYKVPLTRAIAYGTYAQVASLVGILSWGLAADWLGRRAWYFILCLGMFISLAAMWVTNVPTAGILVGLYIVFIIFMGPAATLLYLYATEIYPTRMRALGFSLATSWVRIAAVTGPMLVGIIYSSFSLRAVFAMLAAAAALEIIVCLAFVLETRGRVLEQIAP